MLDYVWLVPLFPLLGLLINASFGCKLKERLVGTIGSAAIGLSFFVSLLLFFDLLKLPEHHKIFELTLFKWIAAGNFSAEIFFWIICKINLI